MTEIVAPIAVTAVDGATAEFAGRVTNHGSAATVDLIVYHPHHPAIGATLRRHDRPSCKRAASRYASSFCVLRDSTDHSSACCSLGNHIETASVPSTSTGIP